MAFKMFQGMVLLVFFLNGANGQLSITPSGIIDVTENSRFTIVCSYTGSSTYSLVFWSKNGDVVYTRMASDCSQFDTIVDTTVEFTCTNSKNFTLTFKEVKKNQDGKRWSCVLDTNPSTSSAEVTIKIKVQVTNVELQKNGVTITSDKVEVDKGVPTSLGCNIIPSTSRPPPTVIWYIGTDVKQTSTSTSYIVTASESDHNKEIHCKAYNLQPESQAVESVKPKLYVRVQVTSVELQENGVKITSDTVEVDFGVPTILPFECKITPSTSRPPPTVIWYIGTDVKQQTTNTSYTVTATEADNDKIFYCKAYNRPWNQAVESAKPKLYVRVQVTNVELQKNGNTINTDNVEVNIGIPTTLGCKIIPSTSRPSPTVIWYMGTDAQQNSTSTSYTVTATESDHDKIIYCKAYNRPWNQPVESAKPKLFVRVQVTSVELQKNGVTITSDTVEVDIGVPTTLPFECKIIPSTSRPPPTVIWYIGTDVKQHTTNTRYTVTASEADNDKIFYCKAYNRPWNQAVESAKPKLYVRVKVTSVTLRYKDNTPSIGDILTFTAGTPEPLTCTPSLCRPDATIDWYIGNNSKQSSASTTYSLNAVNADHNEPIYCIGYNDVTSDTERPVSNNPVLYVRVPAAVPLILNESTDGLTLLDGDPSTIQCQSTPTRPAATISWKIGNSVFSDTDTREVTEAGGLVSIISTLSLVVQQVFDNTEIICQSKINGQTGTPETRKLLKVWWRPSKPSVQTINGDFPWVEGGGGQLTCVSANYGNPNADIKWTPNIGTMNAQNQLVIDSLSYLDHRKTVTCGMKNAFTEIKDENIESEEITLNVEFSPKFLTKDVVFVGKIKENVNITFRIYCNPKVDTAKLYVNGSVTKDNGKYVLMITEGVSEEPNITITITIMDLVESDFASYSLDVTNSIDTTEVNFSVTSESIPSQPTAFGLKELRGSIAIFYWERGFNGGHKQRFLLQLKSDTEESWSNKTIVEEHDMNFNLGNSSYVANISNLKPGTYKVRLIAVNLIGAAEPVLLETVFTIHTEDEPEAFPVAAAAGGGVGAAVLIIAIVAVVLVIWKRRNPKDDDFNRNIIKPPRGQDSSDNCEPEITMNVMYESAENVQRQLNGNDAYAKDDKPLNIYEKVNKVFKKKSPEPTNDVYSQVQKPKKKDKQTKETDKKKMKKQKKGKNNTPKADVYENVDSHTDTTQDDKIYENHQCSIEDEKPKRTKNQDGLIYVKVDLPNKTDAQNMRPIIHGEDDRTIYAEVAFGEVGEPLPESDEEDTTEKQ